LIRAEENMAAVFFETERTNDILQFWIHAGDAPMRVVLT
jgi:hypothetical protein